MLLIACDPRGGRPADPAVRRYRLARVRLGDPPTDALPSRDARLEHLRRSYD